MNNNKTYIDRLEEKLTEIDDLETLKLIRRLIIERENLLEEVSTDALTGLNNRRIIDNIDECSAVVMCDIDDFKHINDFFGHKVGDQVLVDVARVLKNNVKEKDYLCRFGGDEFFIAFVDKEKIDVLSILKQIKNNANRQIQIPKNYYNLTMSFGIAFNDGSNIETLIEDADYALYKSKRTGKNKITIFDKPKTKVL